MVFAESLVITHLVPLVTLGGSKDRKMIIGAETFNDSRCEGNPETYREFRNSIGKCTAWDSSSTESNDLYSTDSPGNFHLGELRCTFQKARPYSLWIYFGHQFIYVAYKGSYTFRQLNYIRAGVYRILTISDS